jgi:hypothetical protein
MLHRGAEPIFDIDSVRSRRPIKIGVAHRGGRVEIHRDDPTVIDMVRRALAAYDEARRGGAGPSEAADARA